MENHGIQQKNLLIHKRSNRLFLLKDIEGRRIISASFCLNQSEIRIIAPSKIENFMDCRKGCGACCIYPSISSSIPGMPNGKPAGVTCIQLNDDLSCKLFTSPERPKVCGGFKAEKLFCGESNLEAYQILASLEGINP